MKIAMFTDIHFGDRNNSSLHNQDCHEFIDWMLTHDFDKIVFLGDWFHQRHTLNISTLISADQAKDKLAATGKPVYFITGNHDLHLRNTRDISSTSIYKHPCITTVQEPISVDNMLFVPFLFRHEYEELTPLINKHKYVFGHFEFKNFTVTGNKQLDHAPDHRVFSKPKYIFSGHFHKRQINANTIYIGNPFSTNYGDIRDPERGFTILDTDTDDVTFYNYPKAPIYQKLNLSLVLKDPDQFLKSDHPLYTKLVIDEVYAYTDLQAIRESMLQLYSFRELVFEEDHQRYQEALSTNALESSLTEMSIPDTIIELLQTQAVSVKGISQQTLIELFQELL